MWSPKSPNLELFSDRCWIIFPVIDIKKQTICIGMHWGGQIFNFQNIFDRACDEIRMERQTENFFRSLISMRLPITPEFNININIPAVSCTFPYQNENEYICSECVWFEFNYLTSWNLAFNGRHLFFILICFIDIFCNV